MSGYFAFVRCACARATSSSMSVVVAGGIHKRCAYCHERPEARRARRRFHQITISHPLKRIKGVYCEKVANTLTNVVSPGDAVKIRACIAALLFYPNTGSG